MTQKRTQHERGFGQGDRRKGKLTGMVVQGFSLKFADTRKKPFVFVSERTGCKIVPLPPE
jgi:hypothetical protein